MSNFYEFILYVELTEDVDKNTIELSNNNSLYRIKQWSDVNMNDETTQVREVVFESQFNIYNYILQKYAGFNVRKLIGYIKTPLYI